MKRASSHIANRLAPLLNGWYGWVVFGIAAYIIGMYLASGTIYILARLGAFAALDATSFALVARLIMYGILATVMIIVPRWLKHRVSLQELGLGRAMQWKDIGLGIAGLVIYLLLAMGALALLRVIPGVNTTQAQDLDVGQVYGVSRMMVFVVLVVITPFVEEVLFRGVFYGGLRARRVPMWAAALIVSVLFGFAHGQLNVGIDVFCLSMVACYARELTGSLWAGTVLHMIKNFIAFAVVYIINQG
ncbi:MAG: type II CAAX endopeptidase family protein [Candidatus Saccharimonas sp.]